MLTVIRVGKIALQHGDATCILCLYNQLPYYQFKTDSTSERLFSVLIPCLPTFLFFVAFYDTVIIIVVVVVVAADIVDDYRDEDDFDDNVIVDDDDDDFDDDLPLSRWRLCQIWVSYGVGDLGVELGLPGVY